VRLGAVGALTGPLVMLGSFQHDCMLMKTAFHWLGAAHFTFSVSSRVRWAGRNFRPIAKVRGQAQYGLNPTILRLWRFQIKCQHIIKMF
jgi:hypothetical protein